jgi:hypothetical protein
MPKKELTIFVLIDFILVAAAIFAVFQHVKVLYVIAAFGVLTGINGLFLIISVVKQPRG